MLNKNRNMEDGTVTRDRGCLYCGFGLCFKTVTPLLRNTSSPVLSLGEPQCKEYSAVAMNERNTKKANGYEVHLLGCFFTYKSVLCESR